MLTRIALALTVLTGPVLAQTFSSPTFQALTLTADPAAAAQAVRRSYLDARINLALPGIAPCTLLGGTGSAGTVQAVAVSTGLSCASGALGVVYGAGGALRATGGDGSAVMTLTPGSTTPRSLAARAGTLLDVRDFGAAFNGVADDTAAINAAIAQAAGLGGGIVLLPPGASVVSGLVPRSGVWLLGAGQRATMLKCAAAVCLGQVPGTQLNDFRLTDLNIQPLSPAYAGATVLSLSAIQVSDIGRLLIEGFSSGTWLSLGGTVATGGITDTNLGSNVIFNHIHDVTVFGCGTCSVIQGHYGSVATPSPAASANQPDQVVTQNKFDNINLYYVATKGWDIIAAADTNVWTGGLINLSSNGAVAIANGDDANYTGNTYVNSNKFFGTAISKQSNVTAATFFFSRNYTFGLEAAGFETDIDTSAPGIVPVNMTASQSHRLCGKRLDQNANLLLGCLETGIAWRRTTIINPSNSFVYAVPAGYNEVLMSGSGTLSAGQLQLPCAPPDQLDLSIATTVLTVTSLTIASCSGGGQSIYGSPGTISPTAPLRFRFIAGSNSWVRS